MAWDGIAVLVDFTKELGIEANGHASFLKVVLIPMEVNWEIEKSPGIEHVSERHRTWR
jgi:hypothetical protein